MNLLREGLQPGGIRARVGGACSHDGSRNPRCVTELNTRRHVVRNAAYYDATFRRDPSKKFLSTWRFSDVRCFTRYEKILFTQSSQRVTVARDRAGRSLLYPNQQVYLSQRLSDSSGSPKILVQASSYGNGTGQVCIYHVSAVEYIYWGLSVFQLRNVAYCDASKTAFPTIHYFPLNQDRSPSKMTGGLDCEGESSTSTCEAVPSPSKPIATEGERHPSSLLTPLLTVIKREHEAYSAGEITPVLPLEPYPPPPAQETGPCSTLRSRSKQKKVHGKVIKQEESYSRSPSPERYGSGLDRVLPLPVEAQLHSGSSSPSVKHKYDNVSSDEDDSYWSPNHHRRKARKNGNKIEMGSSMDRHAIANKREREIHQHFYNMKIDPSDVLFPCYADTRLQQLRQEGAMRMRVLEAELSLRQQQQHMEQQEHNLKMEILREKLKRLREGKPFAD
ncbi:uncharacterized protein LOC135202122 [Macrobrachium nipponense]|uniref:uncharacterized protein LOC135202122 n=1 Tax=Macrobrachium nipponense TaxID=159736 RepID=UPI0030C8BEF8